jgi:hypothetical protein
MSISLKSFHVPREVWAMLKKEKEKISMLKSMREKREEKNACQRA